MRPAASLCLSLGLILAASVPAAVRAQAPGPETFAKPPETPIELWDAVDYLVRSGQAKKAVPYLNAFLRSNPDDALLLEIRDRYGAGSVLRLEDDPATRPAVEPLFQRFQAAAERRARDPERLERAVAALIRTSPEQDYAVEQLRRAGPAAVPPIVEALRRTDLSPEQHDLILYNLGRLDRTAVPALVAVLDAPEGTLAAEAATALGQIGDPRAVPFLTYAASTPNETVLRGAARDAIARMTGRPFAAQGLAPARLLTSEARRYLTGQIRFPGDTVEIWTWTPAGPAPRTVPALEAEGYLGLKLAQQALRLNPQDSDAQAVLVGLALQQAVDRVGLESFPAQDPLGAYPLALGSGPAVLGSVVELALKEGLWDLGATSASILGLVTDRDALTTRGTYHPLIKALSAPDRRVRFAAAQALVGMEPIQSFPGADRVVPVLAQFVGTRTAPRAVVIDGVANRANMVGSVVKALGYDPMTATTGPQGFRLAAEAADVELIFIEPTTLLSPWKARDLIANLRADARTSGLPIFVYGPQNLKDKLSAELLNHPRLTYVVTPTDATLFKPVLDRELDRIGARPLSETERKAYAQNAAALLAAIATRPGNPYEAGLAAIEPLLSRSLHSEATALPVAVALGDVPSEKAQRSLADLFLDPGQPRELRLRVASDLARSLQRFGPLVSAAQEARFLTQLATESDPALQTAFSEVIGALRPHSNTIGSRLQTFEPASVLSAPGGPQPSPDAAPPAPETGPPAQP